MSVMFAAGREHNLCPKCVNVCWDIAHKNSLLSSRTLLCEMDIF